MTERGRQSCWVVVPAAGIGARMQADRPKQYLPLAGSTVIEQTLTRLLAHPCVTALVVCLAPDDPYWPALEIANNARIRQAAGGAERCHSVLNGLQQLANLAAPQEWVMVHDVARPCFSSGDIDALFEAAGSGESDGYVLGMPVRDTMKRTDAQGQVVATPDRRGLWHAFTPQMFRLGALHKAINRSLAAGQLVTDESSAMENAGYRVKMVAGSARNIKITRPEDLPLAEFFLRQGKS